MSHTCCSIPKALQSIRRQLAALVLLLAGTGVAAAGSAVTVADFNLPPQDSQGWSILTPSSDSRLVYVDSTAGNDATGVFYLTSNPLVGPDPTRPVGNVLAFRTLAAAAAQLRQDSPDWLLLRSGRVWEESLPSRRGRSPGERAVATAWGDGPRPELRTGASRGMATRQPVNLAVVGLRFWAHTRDPDGAFFTSYDGQPGMDFITSAPGNPAQVRDVLIEDCVFRSYTNNVFTGNAPSDPIVRVALRRNIISRNFKSTGGGHSQGLYHAGMGHPDLPAPTILLQENLFDHNGWRIQSIGGNNNKGDGQATFFNHNTYFTQPQKVLFQRNLFLRASSIGTKWTGRVGADRARAIVIEDNLYAEGEVGISMGGNSEGAHRFDDITIVDNVFTDIGRTRPTNRSLSWGIEAIDWLSGTMSRNLLIHQRTPITNTWAIRVTAPTGFDAMVVENNVIANIRAGTGGGIVRFENGDNVDNVLFNNNIVQSPTATAAAAFTAGGYVFSGNNRYHSTASADRVFRVNGSNASLAQWIAATGDAQATFAPINFPAPERDLETYVEYLGLGSGFDDFLTAVHGQSRANWNPALTAGAINDWLRGGFGLPAIGSGNLIFSNGFEP